MSITIFQKEKTPFYSIRTRNSKTRKIDIFPKGLTHGFGPKMAIFPFFYFQAIQACKMSLTIFQNQKAPFQAIKTRRSKNRKIDIFPKRTTHGFGPKNGQFSNFFWAVQARKMSFTIFQNEKTPFNAIKTRSSKTQKINIFSKEFTHGFGPKLAIFTTFFFQEIQPRKMSFTIFYNDKAPFQAIKSISSRNRKNYIFPNG